MLEETNTSYLVSSLLICTNRLNTTTAIAGLTVDSYLIKI